MGGLSAGGNEVLLPCLCGCCTLLGCYRKAELPQRHSDCNSYQIRYVLGDWVADTCGVGYGGGVLLVAGGLLVLLLLYFRTGVSRVFLFWAAFILTRPLGATAGDLLDKSLTDGGMALSRPLASAVIAVFIVACLLVLPQRAGRHAGAAVAGG